MGQTSGQIDYLEIPAPDMEQAKRFYQEVFGWTLQDFGGDYCCFGCGGFTGAFSSDRKVCESGPLIVIHVDDVDATMQRITSAGGEELVPKFSFPGGFRAHFRDPNGNELSVWSEKG